ncbi:MAG: (deoxy)nucleoside triphosphate pyrophosphohydrolase [Clostridia bacterium]|nr:(deoxy)nucleoside triphosphate pyrophosphohydrolase [Clostridia bacterium]MBP3650064.1 (deoxy)nucleoside triphosphate pyrophosphohydrolase [Clostridia bacterium]
MKTIEVVAALLCRESQFLICRRPPHKARAGLFEFPGGKVEVGETPQEALQRECREELGIETHIGEAVADVTHAYPDLTIHLTLYAALPEGEPQPLEHDDLRWITASQLDDYSFCPADVAFHIPIRAFMTR